MIKAFLFDIGKVLLHFDFQRAATQLQTQSSFSAEAIRTEIERFLVPLETGAITTESFLQQVLPAIQYRGSVAEFTASFCDIFTPNVPMWELVERLRSQYPLYLFSNTSEIHWRYLPMKYPQFAAFTDGIYSMRVLAMKPNPAIYEAAGRMLGVLPQEVFYLDDLPANIAAGAVFGFQSHLYVATEHARLLDTLQALNISA